MGVLEDCLGFLSGPVPAGNRGRKSRTGQPPAQLPQRVVIFDPAKRQEVILLTDLLDVPANVLADAHAKGGDRNNFQLRRKWNGPMYLEI